VFGSNLDSSEHTVHTTRTQWTVTVGCVGLLLALGWLDYLTGYELGFFVFYSIPVAITAWHVGRLPAIFMSFGSALVWLMADEYSGQKYSSLFFVYWNIGIRCGCFVINAFTVSKIRRILDQQKQTMTDLDTALAELKELRGLLPVCGVCQSPRNDENYRLELSGYLQSSEKPKAGWWCCPACTERGESGKSQRKTRE